ncbi:MAG: ParA family protein [Beijerinckiaceae bacterium]
MRSVAMVTQKGGSGKSTLAACLAVAAQEAGERVFLIDMDPQKSLTKWCRHRGDQNLLVESVSPAKLPDALAALEKGRVTLVIIDTPAGDTAAADAAIKATDLSVIPARPAIFDIWSSEATRGKIKTFGKEFTFVLNQCPPMQESQRVQDGTAALESMGGLLRPLISSRVAYQEAARSGLGATEIDGDGKAGDEIRQLWASLKRRLGKIKIAPKQNKNAA